MIIMSMLKLLSASVCIVSWFGNGCRVDPFDPNSPLKKMAVKHFPSDMFFVLRVVQLLRGLSTHMGVTDFSTAHQWRPYADDTLRQHGLLPSSKHWWQDSTFTGGK